MFTRADRNWFALAFDWLSNVVTVHWLPARRRRLAILIAGECFAPGGVAHDAVIAAARHTAEYQDSHDLV